MDSIFGSNMSVKEKLDVLDLIIDTLLTHEMMLDAMIGRLEGLCYNFEATSSSDEVLSTKNLRARSRQFHGLAFCLLGKDRENNKLP